MRLTKEQGIIITGYTGFLCCHIGDFHKDSEKRIGRPIFTHEFGDKDFMSILREYYKEDFWEIMPLAEAAEAG